MPTSAHDVNTSNLRMDAAALAGIIILIARVSPRLSNVPWWVKWIHFGIVTIFSLVGIAGPKIVLLFSSRHHRFANAFSHPNILGLDPDLMKWLALAFAVVGTVFYVAVMLLGGFDKKAQRIFSYLVFPCSVLYPFVVSTAIGVNPSPSSLCIALAVALSLVFVACIARVFYDSNVVKLRIGFK
jgi:hypothetical protein